MRRRLGASVGIGVVSFVGPFVVASAVAYVAARLEHEGVADRWDGAFDHVARCCLCRARGARVDGHGRRQASDERDLRDRPLHGVALSAIFIKPNIWFPVFLVVSVVLILALPRLAPWFFGRYGDRVIEPEIKLVFLCIFVLMVLADASNGHAVLPAFVLGLVMSRHYQEHREEQKRLRVVAFAFLTPFFFIKGGMNVSLGAVVSKPRIARCATRGEDGAEDRLHLSASATRRQATRHLHDVVDEHGADVRHDLVAVWAERRDHRQDPVLAARNGRRSLRSRSNSNRGAVVPAGRGARASGRSSPCGATKARSTSNAPALCLSVSRRIASLVNADRPFLGRT